MSAAQLGSIESCKRRPVAEIKRWQSHRYLDAPTAFTQWINILSLSTLTRFTALTLLYGQQAG